MINLSIVSNRSAGPGKAQQHAALLLCLSILLFTGCIPKGDTGVSGTVADVSGKQLADVQITCGKSSATSGSDGSFKLPLKPGLDQIVIFSGSGLVTGSLRVDVHQGVTTYLPVKMMPRNKRQTIDTTQGGTVTGPRGAGASAPPEAFVDKNGAPVGGEVDIALTPYDPAIEEEAQAYPGELRGYTLEGNTVPLPSYGLLDVQVTKNNEPLQIAPGKTMDLVIPAPSAGTKPDNSPVWYYEEKEARWVEIKNQATYDAGTNTYHVTIDHLTTYNVGRAMDPSCVNGLVQDAQGNPVVSAIVTAQQVDINDPHYNRGIYARTYTDENGNFCLTAERDETVLVTVTDQSGKKTIRTFTAGSTRSNVYPADCSQASCIQLKTIVIGTEDPGQQSGAADCSFDPADNPFLNTCGKELGDFFICFHPEGECFYKMDFVLTPDNMTYEISFANGSRAVSQTDVLSGQGVKYYGPNPRNEFCGQISSSSNGTVITTASGASFTMQNKASGAVEITCPSGFSFVLDGAQKDAFNGCNGQAGNAGNSGGSGVACKPYPGSFMSSCATVIDCNEGYQCCGPLLHPEKNKCVPADMCDVLEQSCVSDDECTPLCDTEDNCMSQVCCSLGFFDTCLPQEYCK